MGEGEWVEEETVLAPNSHGSSATEEEAATVLQLFSSIRERVLHMCLSIQRVMILAGKRSNSCCSCTFEFAFHSLVGLPVVHQKKNGTNGGGAADASHSTRLQLHV